MARIHMNFMSYSLGYPTNIDLILPTLAVGDCDPKKNPSHKIDGKYPILYLLHGHANDGGCWLNYTSVSRYAEEHRIAVCMVSTANVCYMNAPAYGENYYDLVHKEIPELLENITSENAPDIFLCVGKKDFLYEDVIWLHKSLVGKKISHRFDDIAGYDHEYAFWDMELLKFIEWLPRTDAYAGMELRGI